MQSSEIDKKVLLIFSYSMQAVFVGVVALCGVLPTRCLQLPQLVLALWLLTTSAQFWIYKVVSNKVIVAY